MTVEASTPPPDALTVTSPEIGAQTPRVGIRAAKLARPAPSVIACPPPGRVGPLVKVTGAFGGKLSTKQANSKLGPFASTVVGLHVNVGAC